MAAGDIACGKATTSGWCQHANTASLIQAAAPNARVDLVEAPDAGWGSQQTVGLAGSSAAHHASASRGVFTGFNVGARRDVVGPPIDVVLAEDELVAGRRVRGEQRAHGVERLAAQGIVITPDVLMIAETCPLILPIHRDLDALREDASGAGKIGTTRRGIGPAYEDKVGRRAIRVCDLAHLDELDPLLDRLCAHHDHLRAGFGRDAVALPVESALHVPSYMVQLLAKFACYAMVALALDLIWGFTGILSLGANPDLTADLLPQIAAMRASGKPWSRSITSRM